MSDRKPSEVLGALPRTRPHRRSDKRAARPAPSAPSAVATTAEPPPAKPRTTTRAKPTTATPAKPKAATKPGARTAPTARAKATPAAATKRPRPAGTPRVAAQKAAKPEPENRSDILGTAVQAAAELAEIGLTASARALRGAVSRLPRP